MKTTNQAKEIDSGILRHYLETRKIIAERAGEISNVSHMLSLLKYCAEETVPVSTDALAYFSDMINFDICRIIESLDDFIYTLDAESVLNETSA